MWHILSFYSFIFCWFGLTKDNSQRISVKQISLKSVFFNRKWLILQKLLRRLDDLNVFAFISVCTFWDTFFCQSRAEEVIQIYSHNNMLELCTHPIPVQKEDIEPILSFYTQLLGSDWFLESILFDNESVHSIKYKIELTTTTVWPALKVLNQALDA